MDNMLKTLIGGVALLFALTACAKTDVVAHRSATASVTTKPQATLSKPQLPSIAEVKQELKPKYANKKPSRWGEHLPGIIDRLPTDTQTIALTFDACGGEHGSGYDSDLIQYLEQEQIPATLFINSRWIEQNRSTFMRLANHPLFEIENHGTVHRPLSVNGKSIYGIAGTQSVDEAMEEVLGNDRKILELTGRKPKFFRSGTAYYDDVAVQLVRDLGEQPVNFDIVGDAGATYSAAQVKQALLKARPGSIVIMHFNRPEGETAEGLKQAIPLLQQKGYLFVKLEDLLK